MIQEYYLRALLNGTLSSEMEKNFVLECHELVLGFLELKWRQGALYGGQKPNHLRDLAWDCLALAFESKDLSPMLKFRENLISVLDNPLETTHEDLLIATRRILFQVVNDELFNHYKDTDPALTKLIRGIKATIKNDPDVSVITRGNKKFVCFCASDKHAPFEEVSPELFQIRLNSRAAAQSNATILFLMQLSKDILNWDRESNIIISLYTLASCFKEFYALRSFNEDETYEADTLLLSDELTFFIEMAINELQQHVGKRYLDSGKITHHEWTAFISVIREILIDQYGSEGSIKKSYFEYMSAVIPELNRDNYQLLYRSQLEYLLRLCRERMINLVKKEIRYKEGRPVQG
jgi:hypothetical protein